MSRATAATTATAQEPIEQVRDELVKYGVTVNGLPILEGEGPEMVTPGARADAVLSAGRSRSTDPLEEWFRENVKGGPGSFVLPANGYSDFGRAIRQKFVLEVSQLGSRARRTFAAVAGPNFFSP